MKRLTRGGRRLDKGAIELIEEAVHLLRRAPLAVLASYYAGTLSFVLALLYFWADMSRSPWAYQHLAGEALGLGTLFVWMKLCQSIFAGHLRALMAGEPPPTMVFRRCRRILISQATLQSTGLFLLPLALVLTLPFGWVYAFYQNATALDDGEGASLRSLIKEAQAQALLWPKQNHLVLVFLSAFGLFVFLNWTILCLFLPGLIKTLFGVESIFSRSVFSLLNTTFFAVMFGLTYLCVDPILKATFALRCFYGQSRQSGEDLKAELKQHSRIGAQSVTCLALTLLLLQSSPLKAAEQDSAGQSHQNKGQPMDAFFPVRGMWGTAAPCQPTGEAVDWGTGPECARRAQQAAIALVRSYFPGPVSVSTLLRPRTSALLAVTPLVAFASRSAIGAEGPEPIELDHKIEQVLQQQKYTWRMPREKLEQPETGKGLLGRFLERVRQWLRSVRDWVIEWLRKLFHPRAKSGGGGSSGYGWMLTLQLLLYALAAVVVVALAILVWRIIPGKRRKRLIVASEAIQPAPDLRDENVGPEQLPEDGWTTLGRDLLERGELRLALRAFYLASLAHLASRQLISLAKFKSNRDYERELRRRGHSLPRLLSVFADNVQVFDRVWYGMHEINRDLVQQFLSSVELMRAQQL